MRRPSRAVVAVAATALVACSGGGDGGTADKGGRAGTLQAGRTQEVVDLAGDPRARPPLAFARKPAYTIPIGPMDLPPITLYGRAVWLADEAGLTVMDAAGGRTVARIAPENKPLYKPTPPDAMSKKQGEELQYRVLPPQVF